MADQLRRASGADVRAACRRDVWDRPTGGLAEGYVQANLVMLPADLAADGVSEWIDLATARYTPIARGQTLHLHATDEGLGPTGEWTIVHDEDGLSWSHAHGKGDAAVRGRAVDLLLAITRRRTAAQAGLEILGDAAVWDGWLAGTPF